MPAAGGAARRLTHAPGMDSGWSWSPDGRTIAFRSERTGNSEVWTIAADGTDERQLTDHPAGDYGPVFSPDGRWLAFSSTRGGTLETWRMPATGGTPERVSGLSGLSTAAPTWSPDGTRLYVGASDPTPRLWSVSFADRKQRVVADLGGRRGSLSLGPPATDGKSLFFPWRNDVGDIWVMDVAPD
jgi:TolB protein